MVEGQVDPITTIILFNYNNIIPITIILITMIIPIIMIKNNNNDDDDKNYNCSNSILCIKSPFSPKKAKQYGKLIIRIFLRTILKLERHSCRVSLVDILFLSSLLLLLLLLALITVITIVIVVFNYITMQLLLQLSFSSSSSSLFLS